MDFTVKESPFFYMYFVILKKCRAKLNPELQTVGVVRALWFVLHLRGLQAANLPRMVQHQQLPPVRWWWGRAPMYDLKPPHPPPKHTCTHTPVALAHFPGNPQVFDIKPRHDSWSHTYCHRGSTWRERRRGRGCCCLIPFGAEWVSFPAEHWRLCVVREQLLGQSTCLSVSPHGLPPLAIHTLPLDISVFISFRGILDGFDIISFLPSFLILIIFSSSYFSLCQFLLFPYFGNLIR